jgi:aryl-alcohol dehydrogenase-like predicted oxidoreductase
VRQGKTRYIGFSEWIDQIRRPLALGVTLCRASRSIRCSGAPGGRGLPALRAECIGQIVWSPLAQDLTGKYRPGAAPPPTLARRARRWARSSSGGWTSASSRRAAPPSRIAEELGDHALAARARVGAQAAGGLVRYHRRVEARASEGERRRRA